jgi:PAS domain S-box-containing protein
MAGTWENWGGSGLDLEIILETAHDAFIAIDEQGVIRAWNPAAGALFGWSQTEALGTPLRELVIPERYRTQHDQGLMRFLDTGEGPLLNRTVEIEALRRDGSEFPIELTIAAVPQVEGWSFNAFIRDITDRRRAVEALARLATLVESSADAIVSSTTDGVVSSWNRGAERLLGYSAEKMIGDRLDRLLPTDRAGEANALNARVVGGDAVEGFETERLRRDGGIVDVSITISPIQDETGAVTELSMIMRDVSQRKRVERELSEGNDRLRRLNEQLRDSLTLARHELRRQLTSIGEIAETLVTRWGMLSGEERLRSVSTIETRAQRLQGIADEILDRSRLDAEPPPSSG